MLCSSSSLPRQSGTADDLRDFPLSTNLNHNHNLSPLTSTPRIASAMTRPVIALRQWINLRQSLSPTAGAPLNAHVDFLAPSAHPLALTKRTPSSKRPFHKTRVQNAQNTADPAPAAKRKRQNEQYLQQYQMPDLPPGVAGAMNRDGFFMHCIGEIMKEEVKASWYKKMVDSAGYEYDKAIRDGVLPSAISFKTFKSVKMKLVDASFAARPNAQAIRAISVGECFHSFSREFTQCC